MTYGELYMAQEVIMKLADMSFEGATQIKATNIAKWAQARIDDFNAVRDRFLKEHGEKDQEGNIVVTEDNQIKLADPEAFYEDMNSLGNAQISDFDENAHVFTAEELTHVRGEDRFTIREQAILGKLVQNNDLPESKVDELWEQLGPKSGG